MALPFILGIGSFVAGYVTSTYVKSHEDKVVILEDITINTDDSTINSKTILKHKAFPALAEELVKFDKNRLKKIKYTNHHQQTLVNELKKKLEELRKNISDSTLKS